VLTGLPDGAVASLLLGARALLFPSLAEGFGLPLVEAAALGTPVIASDLPVIREVLGDYPVYLDPVDSYPWMETVKTLALSQTRQTALTPPTWRDHFNTVLNLV
jgi:glycosyltransferase involved in cell wall biosynthesis